MRSTIIGSFVLVICAGLFTTLTATTATQAPPETLYFTVVDKGTVQTFRNRLADPERHYVVTGQPVPGTASITFSLSSHESAFVVEGVPSGEAPLPGELGRLGSFRLVKTDQGYTDPHQWLGNHKWYAERVSGKTKTVLPGKPAPQLSWNKLSKGRDLTIDTSYMFTLLEELGGERPVDLGGELVSLGERRSTEGRDNIRAWLELRFEEMGFNTGEHQYGQALFRGTNFIATRDNPLTDEYVMVTAHIDSVGNQGVDDDGSGVISAMTLLKAVSQLETRYDLVFLGFDQEELGLIGSAAYAEDLNEQGFPGLVGVVNIEMTAFDGDNDGALHVIHCNENTSAQLAEPFHQALASEDLNLQLVDACTNRSDHASFWRYDRPAIVISQNFFGGDSNPCYHRTCDKLDGIHTDYMERVTTALARGLASLVE